MTELAVLGGLLLALAGVWRAVGSLRTRRLARERLEAAAVPAAGAPDENVRRFARRHYLLPWLAAAAGFAALRYLAGVPPSFAVALSLVVGLFGVQLDALWMARKHNRIESQLADAIDLMVSALKVGATLQSAMESALRNARPPFRGQLDEVLARIRFGDVPQSVLMALAQRVPLETFRLFAVTLAVHWEVGGSLTQTLASVGRTIRDRIEVSRRLRALTMQSRASMAAIVLVTYFIAALMWRADPPRMADFLASTAGQTLVSLALVMQAVGMVWISAISKPRF